LNSANLEKTKLRKALPYIVAVLVAAIVIAVFIVAFQSPYPTLYPGEVRNYQGQDLSAIGDVQINTIKGVQRLNQSSYRLTIDGLVNKTLQLTYDDVVGKHQIYQKVVTLYCVEGWDATILWEGVLVKDLLQDAGFNSSAKVAIFFASDGYSTALPLEYLESKNILLAHKMNGLDMPEERGYPFMLAAESQYGYKWIKWVTHIEVSDNENYLGYWEIRGYPNNATLR
jgi:DMSO/TMAO reductase YedYZ molybdopterin-dependent catalytic subunit